MDEFKNYLINKIKLSKIRRWNYDIVLEEFLKNKYDNYILFYKNIEEIVNMSLDIDKNITNEYISNKYPNSLIIHKKY